MKHKHDIAEDVRGGTVAAQYITVKRDGDHQLIDSAVINEQQITIFVNGQELATMMATPIQQKALAVGFMANEEIIKSADEISVLHLCKFGTCVDVWLTHSDFEPPTRLILTSGCAGGVTFDDLTAPLGPLESDLQVSPEQLWKLMDQLYETAALYSAARGVHNSALSDGKTLLITAEDVGRHNTLDKLRGLAMLNNIDTRDCILLTTGRISSEMINKARHMNVPVVCSRTSPTSMSVGLAEGWNITLIGYTRRNSMNIYTHPKRVDMGTEHHINLSQNGDKREIANV